MEDKLRSLQTWKTNFFIIVYLVSLFISKIKKTSCIYMKKKLLNKHYSMLEDKSVFPTITQKTIDQKAIEMMRNQNYFISELRKNAVIYIFIDYLYFQSKIYFQDFESKESFC